MSRIVISDPHGCYKTLMALVAKLPSGVPITFAGDLIDRGKDSKKVVEFVKDNGHDCVVGNHELMMVSELKFVPYHPDGALRPTTDLYHGIWVMNGGDATLESYKVEKEETNADGEVYKVKVFDVEALQEHQAWMAQLPYYRLYDNEPDGNGVSLLVTHSAADEVWGEHSPESPIFKDTVTWGRKSFPGKIDGIFSVFGHTPQQNRPTVKDHFANVDGGAYWKRQPYGKMFALMWPELVVFEQENIE